MNWTMMSALVVYLVGVYLLGYYSWAFVARARAGTGAGFMREYFISGRDLGGFVLAMTLVATYVSAGSFIGGPGTAYTQGLGWVFLAMAQMPTGYLTLALLGKRFAILARKINAVTIVDYLKARYESDLVVILASISIVAFLMASMTAQWVGAARVLQAVGMSYELGLAIFAITLLIYVTVGGFRAVALTDALQGMVMLVGTIAIIIGAVSAGGGVENIVRTMYKTNPDLITPFGVKNFISVPWVSSFWVLVGIGLVGLPQIAVRAMAYRDSKAMHRAIIIGTPVAGFLMLGMHLVGAFGAAVVPGIKAGDLVVPTVTTKVLPEWLAGMFLAGPLAAIMSTVDSMLILVASSIVKDIWLNYVNPKMSDRGIANMSTIVTIIVGVVVYVTALKPPPLLVWLNLFAIAGLEATFFWPILLGLYWRRANAPGAIASMLAGVGSYLYFDQVILWKKPLGMHTVVLPLILALVAFVVVSCVTRKPSREIEEKFWA
ncbi:MAG: sodium/panthothenate symporter [Firmicutes bacterium]|nr:sodium/panthothenate symporter [Bacillota bacterium]